MKSIPLPMSHEELVKAFNNLRDDYFDTKLRLDRLVDMHERHFHNVDASAVTSNPQLPQDFFEHHKPLKE